MWKTLSHLLDTDFIHGDIYRQLFKNCIISSEEYQQSDNTKLFQGHISLRKNSPPSKFNPGI